MRRLGLIFTLLASAGFGEVRGQNVAARVLAVQGTVEVQQGTADWTPARVNQDLAAGAVVRTGARSRTALLLVDETQLKIGPNARLQLREVRRSSNLLERVSQVAAGADQSILNLEAGKAWLRSKRVPARVRVRTPAVTAAIRGTEFVVDVRVDGESYVTVLDGSVDMSNPQGAIQVNSGEQGRARIGESPAKIVIVDPDDAVQWTFFYSPKISPRDYPFRYRRRDEAARAAREPGSSATARAAAQHDAGALDEALVTLRGETSPEAAEIRGWVLLSQNLLGEAFRAFQEAGSRKRALLGKSIVHLRMNEFEQAYDIVADPGGDPALQLHKARLDLVAGEVEPARRTLESIGSSSPEYGLAQGLLANLNLVANRKEEALKAAHRAVETSPESPSAHLNLSLVRQSYFDLPAATRSVKTALSLDPGFVPALVQYSQLFYGTGNSAEAQKVIEQALEVAPEEAAVRSALGFVLLGQGRTDAATLEFERAIQIDSGLANPRLGMGIALMRKGQFPDAVAEILVATTLEPRLSIYHSYLGKAFYEERKFEQAFSALEAATDLDPLDPTPHLYSGIFQNDLNRPGVAVDDFQESIRLNDNRAVYRSRFVLDQDRATRNVQLATAYNRLGLSEWANLETIVSNLDDPTNSSAHLFLANTFLNLPGRTGAAGSELLVGRLLLPVNSNSFNSFNDFTTLYDRPDMNWTAAGAYGSFDSVLGRLVATGGTSRFAYGAVFDYDKTAGFRDGNDGQKAYTFANNFKFALSPHSDILVSYAHQQQRLGDIGQVLIKDETPDPDESTFTRSNRVEVGYHRRLRPGSELMFYFAGRTTEIVTDDLNAVLSPSLFRQCRFAGVPPPCGFVSRRTSLETPNYTFQGAHYLKVKDFDFKYGVDFFEGRRDDKLHLYYREDEALPFPPEDPELIVQDPILEEQDLSYRTLFLHSNYHVSPELTLTGGLNYEWSNDDNVFIGPDDVIGVDDELNPIFGENNSDWRLNPQVGALYSPLKSSTLRVAVIRSRQALVSGGSAGAFTRERLVPVHVNGFLSNLNEVELARSWSYNLGWDQRIGRKSFIRATGFRRDREIPNAESNPLGLLQESLFEGELYGAGVVWNQFLHNQVTFVTGYDFTQDEDLFSFRREHEGSAGFFYINPRGFFLSARENFFQQNGRLGVELPETRVFTTDASVAYEFPEKRGLISFRVSNLFDRRYQFLVDPLALSRRIPMRQYEFTLRLNF